MTTIKPSYVTFEQAKWLNEKGFDYHKLFEDFSDYYFDRKVQGRIHISDFSKGEDPDNNWIPVPEQHQVVEWIRINYNIWVSVFTNKAENWSTIWSFRLDWIYPEDHPDLEDIEPKQYKIPNYINNKFNLPKDAYSAAFDYIQNNNLI